MNCTKRYVISIFILIALVCAASAQGQGYRPSTGTFIKDMLRNGCGELVITNDDRNRDALAVLTNLNKEPLIEVFIRSGESFRITEINDGQYDIYFKLGKGLIQTDLMFQENEVLYKLNRALEFNTKQISTEKICSERAVALKYAAPNVNEAIGMVPVSEEDFPALPKLANDDNNDNGPDLSSPIQQSASLPETTGIFPSQSGGIDRVSGYLGKSCPDGWKGPNALGECWRCGVCPAGWNGPNENCECWRWVTVYR
ncbi:MAG: hypothetical protein IPI63_12385 [Methanothrix sp.]|mgnify:CR=1 FL=1|jgi:hypothetical protein|uniref:hypothetical protein n=1 Tax=Methanothrix sp. TaxID=90426 RepID=UPI0025D7961C|nr:hypothetical protein [Methanothrix sp.]MBK7387454.1 hypothetical protein [Methanothrix sp.]HPW72381.1 hypothetical protein [Methanothrix sp.]